MTIDEQPVTEQLAEFERIVRLNPIIEQLLGRMSGTALPDCWLAAGALFQTVWNVLSDRDPQAGILDYDINYFDDSDLSFQAEDAAISHAAAIFEGIPAEIQVRNEARVHLWYEDKFGVPCPPYHSTRHAISTFPNCSSCVAIRPADERVEIYAPYGLTDLFRMITRPNPVLAPASVYEAKTSRWAAQWRELTVLPGPRTPPRQAAERVTLWIRAVGGKDRGVSGGDRPASLALQRAGDGGGAAALRRHRNPRSGGSWAWRPHGQRRRRPSRRGAPQH